MQSTILVPAPAIIYTFANKYHKTRSSNDIDQDKMATLEAMIKAIKEVGLCDPIKATKSSPEYGSTEHNASLPISNPTAIKW